MQNFAKIFGANVKHAFNEKVQNTIKARQQVHPLLAEQLQFIGFHVPDFAPIKHVFDVAADMADIDFKSHFTKKQAKIIFALCNAINAVNGIDTVLTMPKWFERTQKEKAEAEAEVTPMLDQYDVIGNVSKLTDPEILQEIIRVAQSRLAMAQPALM